MERQNFQGSQAQSHSPSETTEHPCSSADIQIFMGGVRRIRRLYLHHLSHVLPFFVAAPLWWQFAVKLPLSQIFFFFSRAPSLTPALSIWQSRAARALNHPACSRLGRVASPWLPAGGCSQLLFFLFLRRRLHSHAVQKPRAGLLIETADEWHKGFSITLYY